MSAPAAMVSLDEIVEKVGAYLDRDAVLLDLPIPAGLAHHRDRLADTLGRLRRRHPDPADYDRILLDRAAASLDAIDAMLDPTAADYVAAGLDVDDALQVIDRHVDEFYARMGGRP